MTPRTTAGTAAVALFGLFALAGCAPDADPTPTETASFASEEEAFAAAEEVYRAYNDALNARREGSRSINPQHYLTGIALENDIDAQNNLGTHGLRIEGNAKVTSITGELGELRTQEVSIVSLVCIDVSNVSLVDKDDVNVTPPERGDMVAQRVAFVGTKQSLLISSEETAETTTC